MVADYFSTHRLMDNPGIHAGENAVFDKWKRRIYSSNPHEWDKRYDAFQEEIWLLMNEEVIRKTDD